MESKLYIIVIILVPVIWYLVHLIEKQEQKRKEETTKQREATLLKAVEEAGGQLRKSFVEVCRVGRQYDFYESPDGFSGVSILSQVLSSRGILSVKYFEIRYFLSDGNTIIRSERLNEQVLYP